MQCVNNLSSPTSAVCLLTPKSSKPSPNSRPAKVSRGLRQGAAEERECCASPGELCQSLSPRTGPNAHETFSGRLKTTVSEADYEYTYFVCDYQTIHCDILIITYCFCWYFPHTTITSITTVTSIPASATYSYDYY